MCSRLSPRVKAERWRKPREKRLRAALNGPKQVGAGEGWRPVTAPTFSTFLLPRLNEHTAPVEILGRVLVSLHPAGIGICRFDAPDPHPQETRLHYNSALGARIRADPSVRENVNCRGKAKQDCRIPDRT